MIANYEEVNGVRVARKHVGWYSSGLPNSAEFRFAFNQLTESKPALQAISDFYNKTLDSGFVREASAPYDSANKTDANETLLAA